MSDAWILSRPKPALLIVGLAACLAGCGESDADKLKRLRAAESMIQIRLLDYGLMAATGQLPDSMLRDRQNALDSLPIVREEIQRLQQR